MQATENELEDFNFNAKMKESSSLSLKLFHNNLSQKYKNLTKTSFTSEDLWKNSYKFLKYYPVILSTTYSLISSLSKNTLYDYVIIDEASQVDIATGSLAMYCAKNIVVVGDLKQLPNVVEPKTAKSTDIIWNKFNVAEIYRYNNHSILLSCSELFPQAPKVLLREHYRCHPKIIEFCNQKFYNNQLIILSENNKEQPLILYKTVSGNHDRNHINQRQIDVIKHEVISQQRLENCDVGIVSPYRKQTNALQTAFADTKFQADTVDKFQGREKEVVILSTVDNKISAFADNANRLNVAVSRAINQLIVVVSDDEAVDTNIGDLENYIKYNNLEIIKSEVYSVFDYLYKGYYHKKQEFLRNQKKISDFDSENLMFALIGEVLKEEHFAKFDVASFVPLQMLLRDMSKLGDNEKIYAKNILTHVDFLIFDKLSKMPVIVIEVDGFDYHKKGSKQYHRDILKNSILQKYNIPLIRFKTNGSGEKEQLIAKLNEIIG
ncbi:MAG: AAA domain-containing protein [Alphaproteobacteria bacterium]|nr:AAA domain-containing protein [Alphaproteobacteria bacterium]